MIPLSDAAVSVLTRSYRIHLAVESWLGDDLLADAVPVDTAGEETDRSLSVPERLSLTVPRLYRGESWSPTSITHPLAAQGQRLRVQLGIELAGGSVEWFQRGWFLVQETTTDGDSVTVEAVGLLALIEEARLVSPFQPSGTLAETLRALVEPALTVEIDDDLTDRSVPSNINWDDDRLGAVLELLDAWPADGYVHPDGYYAIGPATPSTSPVLELTDGAGGTVIEASGSSTREGAASVVVARGTAADGGQVQGLAYDYTSAHRITGAFNPLPVPFYYESPLLTNVDQCVAAAETILARRARETALEFTVTMVPHPALQVGDVVALTAAGYTDLACTVEALSLPYTADGEQTLTVRSLP
ncbi:DUF5047 domain-containing protein [Plantactinospora sp. B6F1]|uniref:DUF5047 domain-containing protein n=1 Tax=Plantactinospora sp. B6F1 TaxID=3158971 RepID=UPI0032D92949